MSLSAEVPVFGERVAGQRYVVRPSAYALIGNERGEIAVVVTRVERFLPGGGIEPGESPEQAIIREALEECGLLVRPETKIADAVQLVYSIGEETHFEKPSVFFRAVVERVSGAPSDGGYELLWLPAETARTSMAHESHGWVVQFFSR